MQKTIESDKDLVELLDEANKRLSKKYVIGRRELRKMSFWTRRLRITSSYSLYCHTGDNEYQIFNFPAEKSDLNPLFGFNVSRETIITYLLGFLNGWNKHKQKEE